MKEFSCGVPGDEGVRIYRRKIRRMCQELAEGNEPPQPVSLASGTIPTYGSDTVLVRPAQGEQDDELLRTTNDQVMGILFDADRYTGEQRDTFIENALSEL